MATTKVQSELIVDDVALAGNPTTTTQSAGNNTTRIATTAFVTTAINNLINSAPGTLDTLDEIAAALNDDPSFTTTVNNAIATKLPLSGGTMSGALNMGSQNITNAGTITASGGNTNNNDDANILTLNASQHARLLVDTSSTSGHRATLALESNSNELTLSTTGSNSYLINPAGSFNLQIATDKVVSFAPTIGEIGNVTGFQATNTAGSANTDFGIRATSIRLATGSAERVRITDTGIGIGIGSNNPSMPLHLKSASDSSADSGFALQAASNSNFIAKIGEKSTDSGRFHLYEGGVEKIALYADGTQNLIGAGGLSVSGDFTVDTNVLHVDATNNNVGIGDANPPSNTKLAIQADGIGLRLDGTANTTRTIFFRSTTSSNPAQIYADGSLLLRTEDANTDIRFQVNDDEKLRIGTNGYLVAQSASQVRLVLGSTGNSTNNTSNWVRGSGAEMDFNSASGGYNWEVGGNKKMRLAASGKLGVGTTPVADPQHELVVHADSNPTIAIIGDGYNDDISIRFGGGDLTSALGDGNSGAAIHSTQSVSSGAAKGDLRFKVNKGDSLQTALTITHSQSVAVNGSGTAGKSFEVQDKQSGWSGFWYDDNNQAHGRGVSMTHGLLGVNSINYDGDGAYWPVAGFAAAADNASGESVDFWFGTTTSEWQPMTFFAVGAHTSTAQTGQTAGWALIRATHYNNGISVSILDSGGGGTFTTSVIGSLGDDRANTSQCRITYSSNQNRSVISVWGVNYSGFYGAQRA